MVRQLKEKIANPRNSLRDKSNSYKRRLLTLGTVYEIGYTVPSADS